MFSLTVVCLVGFVTDVLVTCRIFVFSFVLSVSTQAVKVECGVAYIET